MIVMQISLFTSCREDEIRLVETPGEKPLTLNSSVASLIQRTSLNDGSIDNIIDKASCLLIKLPVTVIVNGVQLTVNTTDDYKVIEAFFDDDNMDVDTLSLIFPITIILEDYTEILVNSNTELMSYIGNCNSENEEDDDIECIDFNYPFSATTYNVIVDRLGSVTIHNDKELYSLIKNLDENEIVNITFPITLTLSDGSILTIQDLDQLEVAIKGAIDVCDEDDDYDFKDDDNTNLTQQEFENLLTNCFWEIEEIDIDDQNRINEFNEFYLTFNLDGSATAEQNGISYIGSWSINTNNAPMLTIHFDDFAILNTSWVIAEINPEDDGTRLDLRHLEDNMKLKNECN